MKHALLMILSACMLSAHAADLKFKGTQGYSFSGSQVTLKLGGVTNKTAGGVSGSMKVQLWALPGPYPGVSLSSGTVIGEFTLKGLDGGTSYLPMDRTVAAKMPARSGSYSMMLLLSEYRTDGTDGYFITDHLNFSNKASLAPLKLYTLEGPWSWKTNADEGIINIMVKKISHKTPNGTGTLRLELWACSKPYTGGTLSGVKMGSVQKNPLKPGYAYTDVDNITQYTSPPPGTYHVILVLMHYSNGKYSIVDWKNPSSTNTWN